jgi:enoyl-CoA hydratase/carnithine racemase
MRKLRIWLKGGKMASLNRDVVIYEKKDKIAYIKLNRPDKMNAINKKVAEAIREIWADFRDDDNIYVAILSGAGKSFCAGADVKDLGEVEKGRYKMSQSITLGDRPIGPSAYSIKKPIIGALKGNVLGAGLWLALECDIRVATEDAVFGLPEPKIGIPTVFAGILARYMPQAVANELLLVGTNIDAKRAYEIGLINKVVSMEQLMREAESIANTLCNNAPLAITAMKQLIRQCWDMDFGSARAFTESVVVPVNNSEDAEEGKKAYVEKRKPIWRGR